MSDSAQKHVKILDLPDEVLEKVLLYMSYDEIADKRRVCRKFNTVCGQLLNRGFYNIEREHRLIQRKFKSLLPRRESERKTHQYSRHCNILTAVGARINMLSLTYMKYMETNLCCFIPGKVIDEVSKILKMIAVVDTPPRALTVLQELCDVSVMAIEHFDEKISPSLRVSLRNSFLSYTLPVTGPENLSRIVMRDTLQKDMTKVQQRAHMQKLQIKGFNKIVSRLSAKIQTQRILIASQSAKLRQQSRKIREQNKSLSDIKHRLDEYDKKFADITTKINSRNELLTKTIKIPAQSASAVAISVRPTVSRHSPPRIFKSNIKPRSAQILPKNMTFEFPSDSERKRKLSNSCLLTVPHKVSRVQLVCNQDDDKSNNDDNRGFINRHTENLFPRLPTFISSSLETLLKSPITSIKSRKRKI